MKEEVRLGTQKKYLMIKIFFILFMAIFIIITVVFLSILYDSYVNREEGLFLGKYIKEAVISLDGTNINITLEDYPLINATKIKFTFANKSGKDFVYSFSDAINKSEFLINLSDIGIISFHSIRSIFVEFEYLEENKTMQLEVNGSSSNDPGTGEGKVSVDEVGGGGGGGGDGGGGEQLCNPSLACNHYYNLGECGSELSDGCSNVLNCLDCLSGSYCYQGQGVDNVCINENITCIDSDDLNYYNKGNLTINNIINNSNVSLFIEDNCSGNLTEYYCYFNGSEFQGGEDIYECLNGCLNGKCELPACVNDSECSVLDGVCGIGLCNVSLSECYISYNISLDVCRESGFECDAIEYCSGSSVNCGNDVNESDRVVCSLGECLNGVCVGCVEDNDCDNGLFCDGVETCVLGSCQSGVAVDCSDPVSCTDDSCNEATDSCDNIANDGLCGDGLFCNGVETCNALLDCQSGTSVACDDVVACTDDSCNEATDSCDNIANDTYCESGEYCDAVSGCLESTCSTCSECELFWGVGCDYNKCKNDCPSCYYDPRIGVEDCVTLTEFCDQRIMICNDYYELECSLDACNLDCVLDGNDCVENIICTDDVGCTNQGSFCDANTPYVCIIGGDGCLDRFNNSSCGLDEICTFGACVNQSFFCVDGTLDEDCSVINSPLYCNFKNLTFDLSKCGADPGKCCQSVKGPAPYAVHLAVNLPYTEDCDNAYTYFDNFTIGGFWFNTTFNEVSGIAMGIGGYPTNIQCRNDLSFIINAERGVRYKTDSCISVPWNNSMSSKQKQVAILDWNYSGDSYCFFNGTGMEMKNVKYLDCSDFSGDICTLTEYCPGESLKVADTERCCNVDCATPNWLDCIDCGNGLFNTCDRSECQNISEGCYFVENAFQGNDCFTCSLSDNCYYYRNDSQSCISDICGFEGCFWNFTLNRCEGPFDCLDINHCRNYTTDEDCVNDPCTLGSCFYDGFQCQTDVCFDTDGVDYEILGTCFDDIIYMSANPVEDTCSNGLLNEYFCNLQYCQINNYNCSLMGGVCQNGRCVVSEPLIIEIDNCTNLDQANTLYKLNRSIQVDIGLNDDCLVITASNVILDCDSYTITSEDYYSGVYSDQDYTTVRNCDITMGEGYSGTGIELRSSRKNHVYNNTVNSQGRGIILILVDDSIVEGNIAKNNLLDGLYSVSGNHNKFINNLAKNNSQYGIFISEGLNYNLTENTFIYNFLDGIYLTLSNNNIITNNIVNYNRRGIYVGNTYTNNSLINNQFCSNNNDDLRCYVPQTTVTGNECDNINGCSGTCETCPVLPILSPFAKTIQFFKELFRI